MPKPELWLARLIFRWRRSRSDRGKSAANFARGREEIRQRVRHCEDAAPGQRVLIRRIRGLEDSSRHWSVYMTLDHLRIVNDAVTGAITALVAGHVPPRQASTADVKPHPNVDRSLVAAFEASCRPLEQCVAAAPDLATRVKYAHPWFGPLDAADWHFMAGFHLKLHLKQIDRILAGLPWTH